MNLRQVRDIFVPVESHDLHLIAYCIHTHVIFFTGLDSTSSTALVSALRTLADSGKTIIAVIHQPSQHVFAAFDDLLLVSEGKQMYYGPVSEVCNRVHNLFRLCG